MTDEQRWEGRVRKLMAIGVALFGGIFTAAFLYLVILGARKGILNESTLAHVPTIIGLPLAALASLMLVLALRTVSGDIEVKALGFELKGAAGPLIMWILCFLAITLGIVKTWDLTQPSDSTKAGSRVTEQSPH